MHVRIGRRANHDKAGIGTAGDGDHILRYRFGQPNAGIETFRNDIDGTTLQGQFDVHVGMQYCAISRIRSCHFMLVVASIKPPTLSRQSGSERHSAGKDISYHRRFFRIRPGIGGGRIERRPYRRRNRAQRRRQAEVRSVGKIPRSKSWSTQPDWDRDLNGGFRTCLGLATRTANHSNQSSQTSFRNFRKFPQGNCAPIVPAQFGAVRVMESVGLLGIVRSWLVSQPPGFLIIVVASLGTQ